MKKKEGHGHTLNEPGKWLYWILSTIGTMEKES